MRPRRLALSAFGPFAAEQIFDFAALGAHRLFLIHGPTGAGKTTLLDALCFALFGTASGVEREAAHLRSHHAAAETPTWVELEFSLGADAYRIRRSPAQPAIGRGGRAVVINPKVTLWRVWPDRLEVIAEQTSRVREEVERRLGYSHAEFRQVVVLPQGQFREVLTAPPGTRQDILATLFRTGLYRRIEGEIAARARSSLDEARQWEERRRTLLGEAGAATPEAAGLELIALSERLGAAERQRLLARAAADVAAASLVQGKQTAAILERAEIAASRREALSARAGLVMQDRARAASARRATTTLAADLLLTQAEAQAARAEADRDAALRELAGSESRLARARGRLRDETARAAAIETSRAEAARLASRVVAVRAAEQAEARAVAARTRLATTQADFRAAEVALHEARLALVAAGAAHADAARQAGTAALWHESLAQARSLAEAVQSAATLSARSATLVERHRDATRHLARATLELTAAEAARLQAESSWRAHQAAHLARELVAGAPCPVCGATAHPAPHAAVEGALPDLDAAIAAERAARTQHAAVQEAARRADDERLRAEAQLALLRQRVPPDLTPEAAAARVAEAAAQAEQADRAARDVPSRVAALGRAEAAGEAARQALEATREAVGAQESVLAAERGAIQALRADAPTDEGSSTVLAVAAAAASAEADTAARSLDEDRRELARAAASMTAAQAAAAGATSRAADARGAADSRLLECEAASRAAGFADAAAARAARMAPEPLAELEAAVAAFDRDMAQAEALAEQARAATAGLVAPDLPGLGAADLAAREAADGAAAEAARLGERHERAAVRLAAIQDADRALGDARARHERLRDLADGTAGRNDRRLSLEGFVLASILDEALAAATEHLSKMLGGRYRLQRREEPARANAAVGLDIEVLDDWTGQVRPAGTLSGGEGFCAALALALGLADTVQAHAGARRIDMLFIDEGFGSLDEDALDTAMDVLTGLQAGDRLVGIISHVAELRSRIPAQLIVRPGLRGSSAAFAGVA